MDIYKIIQNVSDMLGISIKEPPIVYEGDTSQYWYDTLEKSTKYKIIKENERFIYVVHTRESDKYRCESVKLSLIKDVYDVFVGFISDSYYDSPIRYHNWKRQHENNDSFLLHYQKYPTYFYMGLYRDDDSNEFHRVYVKRMKQEMYNKYITQKCEA